MSGFLLRGRRTNPINNRPRKRDLNQRAQNTEERGRPTEDGQSATYHEQNLHIIAGVSIRISCHRNYVQAGDQGIYSSVRPPVSLQDPMANINFIIIDNIVSHVHRLFMRLLNGRVVGGGVSGLVPGRETCV